MRKLIIFAILLSFIVFPVSAMEYTAPEAPESAQPYMPPEQETFAQGLLFIIKTALSKINPELISASKICFTVTVAVLAMSVLQSLTEIAVNTVRLTGAVVIGILLLESTNTFIQLGSDTITELSEYGKLLLPIMTSALAAQGGITTSAALYTGTVFFIALLTSVITKLIIPGLYIYLCLCIANSAIEQDILAKAKGFVKWGMTWVLKIILYIFTGYISITGVISGAVDASALKAAKLTLSGVVPVVGGILSDATETILVSAGIMKSSAGVYGIFAVLAVCISPFLQIGIQYILLKASGAVCNIFGCKPVVKLIEEFGTGMGFVLAATGSICIMLLISLVCFLRGIGI